MESTVTGDAGNGRVTITIAGSGEVKSLEIDPEVVDPEDVETLQDLVLGAFQDASAARPGEDGPAVRRHPGAGPVAPASPAIP